MKEGVQNVTTTKTSCADTDHLDFTQNFMGSDSRISDFHTNSSGNSVCGDGTSGENHDTVSTIDFGNFYSGGSESSSPVAATCVFLEAGSVTVETADIRLNRAKYWLNALAGCVTGRYDLQAVLTHETGHAFALDDVYGEHDNLTMYAYTEGCETKKRTLARGDIDGLELYDP